MLNRTYRDVDKTTDVLSFADGEPLYPDGPLYLGDVAISIPQAARQAEKWDTHLMLSYVYSRYTVRCICWDMIMGIRPKSSHVVCTKTILTKLGSSSLCPEKTNERQRTATAAIFDDGPRAVFATHLPDGGMFCAQQNAWIHGVVSIGVVLVGLWLGLSRTDWAILIITITIVWIAEFMNTALEAIIDMLMPDYHPPAKVAKDVAAAAVLVGACSSVLVGLLILGPPLWLRLTG